MPPEPEPYTRYRSVLRTGTDLVAVADLADRLVRQPGLAERVFTPAELSYCRARPRRRDEHLAARFAAKEAVMKALGTGMAYGIEWTDIEVSKERGGRPLISLRGAAERIARERRVEGIDVSLSHTAGLAIAHVVMLVEGPEGANGSVRRASDEPSRQQKEEMP